MAFVNPWWLLFLPLWPLLLVFMRTREQRREHPAPDFLLWQRAAARLPKAASRAQLSWRDALWIAPLVLLTIGLAEPEILHPTTPVEVLVLVDPSASMATKGPDGSTRRARGLAEARRILGSRPNRVEAGPQALVESVVMTQAAGVPVVVVTDRALSELPRDVGLVQVADSARNAGIVAAGFDPEAGLLVRVEADPHAGPRTLVVRDANGHPLASEPIPDPASWRKVFPASLVEGALAPFVVRIEPPDALTSDDEVRLVFARSPLRVAIEGSAPPPVERALRACPGVEVVHGSDPTAVTLLVAPIADVAGFETGPAVVRDGALSGPKPFEDLQGPSHWKAIFPVVKQPEGTEVLLAAGAAPLLVRHARTFALLANPDENGWASIPSFPLAIARLVEVAGAGASSRPEVDRASAVLSSAATHVARGEPLPPRAPAAREAGGQVTAIGRWCYAGALLAIVVLIVISYRWSAPRSRLKPAVRAGWPS